MSTTTSSGGASDFFSHLVTSIAHGAALVYHQVVAAESNIANWTTSNPTVAPLIQMGLSAANSFASRMGVPTGAISLAAEDIQSALGSMAALDTTVTSGTATVPAVTPGPAAAPPAPVANGDVSAAAPADPASPASP